MVMVGDDFLDFILHLTRIGVQKLSAARFPSVEFSHVYGCV